MQMDVCDSTKLLKLYSLCNFTCSGKAHAEFNGTSSTMQMITVAGDKTAWMHVTGSQVLISEYVEGKTTSTTTQFNIEVGEDAILHVRPEIPFKIIIFIINCMS